MGGLWDCLRSGASAFRPGRAGEGDLQFVSERGTVTFWGAGLGRCAERLLGASCLGCPVSQVGQPIRATHFGGEAGPATFPSPGGPEPCQPHTDLHATPAFGFICVL